MAGVAFSGDISALGSQQLLFLRFHCAARPACDRRSIGAHVCDREIPSRSTAKEYSERGFTILAFYGCSVALSLVRSEVEDLACDISRMEVVYGNRHWSIFLA